VRPSTRRDVARIAFGLGALGLLASLIALLAGLGLDNADKLSSVLGMLVGLLALTVAGLALRPPRPRSPSVVLGTAWDRRRVRTDVVDLLRAMASAANSPHSLMTDDGHAAVSTTYVRQRIEVPRPEAGPAPDPRRPDQHHFLPPGQQPRVIPVRRPLDGTLDANRHLFLEGGPGSGKSTTAAQLCRQLAEGWLTGDPAAPALSREPVLPILITARQLAEHAALPWAEALATAVTGALGTRLAQRVATELLADTVDGVPWLVIIDGLDEVPSDERTTLIGRLGARTAADDPRYRLLVTSRPLAGNASALFGTASVGHYTLVPFDRALLTEFARRWFEAAGAAGAEEAAARFVSEIRASGLLEVAETPLLARIAIKVYADSPDRTLPRNRHDLYERYLQYLESFNRQRRASSHAKLIGELDPTHGRSTADGLYDRLDDLLEHLAAERLTSRNPLVPRAVSWLAAHAVPARSPQPLRWNDHLIEALAATGLITRRAGTIDFLHLTFAEHLAARVQARKLPDRFNAGHEEWQRWIRRAMEEEHAAGTAVLTRWAREHDPAGLLDSLLAGARAANLVAARLVAEGVVVTAAQLAACLAVLEEQVRRRHQIEAWDLIRRFPDTPAVTDWLRRLVVDQRLDPSSQVALCRVHADRIEHSQAEMLARLRELAGPGRSATSVAEAARAIVELAPRRADEVAALLLDRSAEDFRRVDDGVTLATALLDCGEAHRAAAFGLLRTAMTDPGATPVDVRIAAETLVEAGAEGRDHIARVLNDAIAGDRSNGHSRMEAAETLAAIEPGQRGQAVALLYEMAMADADDYTAVAAAMKLGRLSPAHRTVVVERLTSIARRPSIDMHRRIEAAVQLMLFDHVAAASAVAVFCGVLMAPSVGLSEFIAVWIRLIRVDPRTRALIVQQLGDIRGSVPEGTRRWYYVTVAMAACDAVHHAEAEAGLLRIVGDPRTFGELSLVGSVLGLLGSGPADGVVASLVAWATSDLQPVADRIRLMGEICGSFPRSNGQVTAAARQLATSPLITSGEHQCLVAFAMKYDESCAALGNLKRVCVEAAREIAQALPALIADSAHGDDIAAMVDGWMTDRATDFDSRRNIGDWATMPASPHRARILRLLELITRERTVSDLDRVFAAHLIAQKGGMAGRRALDMLTDTMNDVRCCAYVRLSAARLLGVLRPDDAGSVQVVRSLASSALASPGDRALAVEELAVRLGPDRTEPRTVLLRILDEAPDDPEDSYSVLRVILALSPDSRDLATIYAGRLARRDGREGEVGARTLSELNGAESLRADLLRLTAAAACDSRSLLRAAERVSWALPEQAAEVAAALKRLAVDQGGSSADRVSALVLVACSERDRGTALRVLRAAAMPRPNRRGRNPQSGGIDPLDAAEALLRCGPTEMETAGLALEGVLRGTGETTGRRRRAMSRLVESGATAHRAAMLRVAASWLTEPIPDVATRCDLIVAVHRFQPDRRGELAAVLESLRNSAAPADRQHAAGGLLSLDPDHEQAIATLCRLATAQHIPEGVRGAAARRLLKGTDGHREALADAVHGLIRGASQATERLWAATVYCDAVPADRWDGLDALSDVLADATAAPRHRINAAKAIADLCGNSTALSDLLSGFLADEALPGHLRARAGCLLAALPGPARINARRDVLLLPDPCDRLAAALSLIEVPGDCRTDALAVLRVLVAGEDLRPAGRLRAVAGLIEHGELPDRAAAGAALAGLLDDPKTHDWARARAWAHLHHCGAGKAAESVRRLWSTVQDPQADVELRRWYAESLAEIDGTQARHARDALLELADGLPDRRAAARIRRSARRVDLLGARPG